MTYRTTPEETPRRRDLPPIYRKLPTPMRQRKVFIYGTFLNRITALIAAVGVLAAAAVGAYFLQR